MSERLDAFIAGHRQIECRKRLADQRLQNPPAFEGQLEVEVKFSVRIFNPPINEGSVSLNQPLKFTTQSPAQVKVTTHTGFLPPLSEKDFNFSGLDIKIKAKLVKLLISRFRSLHHRISSCQYGTSWNPSIQPDYPIKCPIYKIPFNLRNEFRQQIADLEKAGIISKSKSQYNTPALFVKQKEKWRIVLDFRKLNEITLTQDFAIPILDDILDEVSNANYSSALDMKLAFNQIPLALKDRHKRLHFLHLMVINEHFELFSKVLERFEKIQLKVNPGKCPFLTKSCKFLGFVITPEGIHIDKDKPISINEFPVLTDQKQIKSFLGCCNFYRRYIKNFAKRALPLTNLLRKDIPFEWTSETQAAFEDIKKAILNPPVLALPDPAADLQITTDASSYGIGAILEQKYPNSKVKPIFFFSKKLNPSQFKYNATVLEFFAIYTALNFFRPFLLGRKFKVFTDHKPLSGFLSNKIPSSKILRWKLAVEEFNYEIHYIKGSLNSVADHLSRYVNNITIALPESKDLIEMQRNDPVLSDIIQKINSTEAGLQRQVYFFNEEGLLCHLSRRPSKSPRQGVRTQIRKIVFVPMSFSKKFLPQRRINQSHVPGETCHIDIFSPLKPTPRGNKFVFDAFTKYIHRVPLPD
ncbi:retrovirus-related Pol polyprotein from transposon 17.6 [Trichonephila inaurata madagascariensis]|uniref:Retrovirus-related Pol polyprotein from transposon 17.6 n=1 Tax=Trichonephila inaurata madagascariensis TaxID=2747483 RepID=A0A8X6YLM1_9ARAC|nr:retrovirus-related Pol polyprotein from transposon 17.6 [Trichonephila inaurata madagascariensis]